MPQILEENSELSIGQRLILPARQVIEHYGGVEKGFQEAIFKQTGIPPMHGLYKVIYTYPRPDGESVFGTLNINLESETKGKNDNFETFIGNGYLAGGSSVETVHPNSGNQGTWSYKV